MKKVILAFAGSRFSESAMRFAIELSQRQPLLLVGVFLPEAVYGNMYSFGTGLPGEIYVLPPADEDLEMMEKNQERFAELCQKNDIRYRIHKDYEALSLPELTMETRFADLMILSSEQFYDGIGMNDLNPSLRQTLRNAECPVLVVPAQFAFPKRNILAYDGGEDAVYAIKQFTYLFPELCGNETALVYAKDEADVKLPGEQNIEELAAQHFSKLELMKLQLNAKKYFGTWVSENEGALLVTGSYGRSELSQVFRKSFADEVIADHKLPVFIAHR